MVHHEIRFLKTLKSTQRLKKRKFLRLTFSLELRVLKLAIGKAARCTGGKKGCVCTRTVVFHSFRSLRCE